MSSALPRVRLSLHLRPHPRPRIHPHHARTYTTPPQKPRSGHAEWYASMLPAMIPVALLGSAVYMALHLVQTRLAHEKALDDARAQLRVLEAEVDALTAARAGAPESGKAKAEAGSWWRFW
ncbi:hypothetical protein BV22DRAFT_1098995 [Leucogyrophana mollusca]|uniref:Uncharacterized protein n=1 Tax=Leucogyrophana mollusca TaxID=85980 RepID=A0ACB8B2W0_9AGAM|nr:hypothetical protein BV22DRAFT_1098995 [Leucogyrophana mollusca]